ncbi:hypothetical protein L7F22_066136 [Adiantum nelumboides]|nr:hypothetical protein [Adiantum nelumboides]
MLILFFSTNGICGLLSFKVLLSIEQDEYEATRREREIEEVTKKEKEEENQRRFQEDQALEAEELQAAENLEKENHALRLELEQQIAEQRNREWEAVLARDHEVLLMMKHDCDNEVNFEQRLWQEERQRKLEQRHLKHRNLCREVLLQITNLAESSALYKESTNCTLSTSEWWEWKSLFVRGAIQPLILNIESLESDNTLLKDEELAEEIVYVEGKMNVVVAITISSSYHQELDKMREQVATYPNFDSVMEKLLDDGNTMLYFQGSVFYEPAIKSRSLRKHKS